MATSTVEVFVKLQSGRAVSSTFGPHDTVAEITSFVAREEGGVPDQRVRLKYQGKVLDTRKTIDYLGIRPETILRGEIIEPKDWTVSVVFPDGHTEKISVQNISKVSDLKTKIDRAGGVSPSDQKLEVKGGGNISSENHRMLCDVGVSDGTEIKLTELDDFGQDSAELDDSRKQDLLGSFDAGGRNVEVAFCFDTTGSMYSCLKTVRRKLRQTCQRLLRDIPKMRIAIMAHGDYCDYSNYVERHVDLTSDVDTLVKFADKVPSTGGGDAPECYEWALRKCQQLDWSEDSAKAFVMIGDCLPHQPGYTDQNIFWLTELDILIGMGVKVYGVQAYNNSDSTPFYKEIAERSGGFYLQLNHFDLITDMFLAVCYKESNPDQLDAFIDEVQQEGRLTGDTKDLLEKLDEDPKKKEKKEEQPEGNWWDAWLAEEVDMQYVYVPDTDTWRPAGYADRGDDDDDDDDDPDDGGHRGGRGGRARRRRRDARRGRGRGGFGRGRARPWDSADDHGVDWRAPSPPEAPHAEDWEVPPAPVVPAEDWGVYTVEDWGEAPVVAPEAVDDDTEPRRDDSRRTRRDRRGGRGGGRGGRGGGPGWSRGRGSDGRGRGRGGSDSTGGWSHGETCGDSKEETWS